MATLPFAATSGMMVWTATAQVKLILLHSLLGSDQFALLQPFCLTHLNIYHFVSNCVPPCPRRLRFACRHQVRRDDTGHISLKVFNRNHVDRSKIRRGLDGLSVEHDSDNVFPVLLPKFKYDLSSVRDCIDRFWTHFSAHARPYRLFVSDTTRK